MFLLYIYTLVRVQNVCLPDNRTKRAVSISSQAMREIVYFFPQLCLASSLYLLYDISANLLSAMRDGAVLMPK